MAKATRTISMRLAIDGEREFRDALAKCNSELKKTESELKLAASEYKENANSIEALVAKQKALANVQKAQADKVQATERGYQNARKAVEQYARETEELRQKIEANRRAAERLKESDEDTAKAQADLAKETNKLEKELGENEAKLEAAQKGVNRWETDLNKAKIALNETNSEIRKNDKYLDEARQSADGTAKSIDNFGRQTRKAGQEAEAGMKQAKVSVEDLASALVAAGIGRSIEEIVRALEYCIEASMKYESALKGVEKTTNMSAAEMQDMSAKIKEMSKEIPMTADELAKLAETAGQLGIKGKENIATFTEVMAKLGTATNMTAEEAATMLAQFANITRLDPSEYEALGSSIVALGNNTATTEDKIVRMSQGIAASADLAGMSEADIVALAASVTSLGIEVDAGATSMNKLITKLDTAVKTGDGLENFAKVAGMSADQFKKAWGDDAAGALDSFIQGLGRVEKNGGVLANTLSDLGITEERLTKATKSLAGAGDLLGESLEISRNAWKENNALAREAGIRYESTESKLQLFKNSVNLLAVEVGDQLKPAFNGLLDAGTSVMEWLTDFIDANQWLIPVLTGLTVTISVLTAGVVSFTVATTALKAAWVAFKAFLDTSTGGITLLISAVAGVVTALIAMQPELDEDAQKIKRLSDVSAEAAKKLGEINEQYEDSVGAAEGAAIQAERYLDEMAKLEEQGELTSDQQSIYNAYLNELKQLLPDVNFELDEQTGLLKKGAEAFKGYIEAQKKQAIIKAQMEKNKKLFEEYGDLVLSITEAEETRAKKQLEMNELEEKRAAIYERLIELNKLRQEGVDQFKDEAGNVKSVTVEYQRLNDEFTALGAAQTEANSQLQNINSTIEKSEETRAKYDEQIEGLTGKLEKVAETANHASAAQAGMNAEQQKAADSVSAAEEAYAKAQEIFNNVTANILANTASQVTGFQELKATVELSTDDMIARWQQQQDYYASYAENLKRLSQLGVNEGLVAAWADGSVQSAGYIQSVVDHIDSLSGSEDEKKQKTQEFINSFNSEYEKTEQAREKFAQTCASMDTEFRRAMDNVKSTLDQAVADMNRASEAAQAGSDTAQGVINGLMSRLGAVREAGAALGRAAKAGYQSEMDINSPSRVMEKQGEFTAEGAVIGVRKRLREMNLVGGELGKAEVDGYRQQIQRQEFKTREMITRNIRHVEHHRSQQSTVNMPINIKVNGKMSEVEIDRMAKQVGDIFRRRMPEGVIVG